MLLVFTSLFIIYEIAKILFPEKYISLLLEMSEQEVKDKQEIKKLPVSKFFAIFTVEIVYMIFVISLIFTLYWYVGLLLIVLALVYKKRLTPRAVISDSVISIIVLMLIFLV